MPDLQQEGRRGEPGQRSRAEGGGHGDVENRRPPPGASAAGAEGGAASAAGFAPAAGSAPAAAAGLRVRVFGGGLRAEAARRVQLLGAGAVLLAGLRVGRGAEPAEVGELAERHPQRPRRRRGIPYRRGRRLRRGRRRRRRLLLARPVLLPLPGPPTAGPPLVPPEAVLETCAVARDRVRRGPSHRTVCSPTVQLVCKYRLYIKPVIVYIL